MKKKILYLTIAIGMQLIIFGIERTFKFSPDSPFRDILSGLKYLFFIPAVYLSCTLFPSNENLTNKKTKLILFGALTGGMIPIFLSKDLANYLYLYKSIMLMLGFFTVYTLRSDRIK